MSSQSRQDLVVGPRQLGRYELIAKIAAGGMAEVFLARQHGPMGFQKVVVVKTIHEHLARQQSFIDMFLDEARVSALIKHHNVVDIYDLGHEDDTYFIAMEYIPGQALSKVMSLCQRTEPLDVDLTVDLMAAAANGLDAAHDLTDIAGEPLELVHRDVSPGNILVSYNGAVKLVDFGVAKSLGSISSSQASVLKGKIGYASPEQLEDRPIDRRSDVFSLGIVLWEALVFQRLFKGSSAGATVKKILESDPPPPSSEREGVPPEIDAICLKALARDPDDRYQTAGEMRAAFLEYLQERKYHSDQEILSRFMTQNFAKERARERELIAQIASEEPDQRPSRARRKSRPPTVTGIVAGELGPPTPDETAELPAALVEEEDDDELEISVEEPGDDGPIEAIALPAAPTPKPPPATITDKTRAITHAGEDRARKIRLVAAAIGGLAALIIVIAIAMTGDKPGVEESQAKTRDPKPAATTKPEKTPAVTPDAAPEKAAVPVDAAPEPVEIDAAPKPPRSKADKLAALGDRAFDARQTKEAKSHYKKALGLDSNHPRSLRGLALVYARFGRGKQARYYLNRYLRAAPKAPDAASLRRRVYNSSR